MLFRSQLRHQQGDAEKENSARVACDRQRHGGQASSSGRPKPRERRRAHEGDREQIGQKPEMKQVLADDLEAPLEVDIAEERNIEGGQLLEWRWRIAARDKSLQRRNQQKSRNEWHYKPRESAADELSDRVRAQPEPGISPCDQEHGGDAPRKAEGSEGAQDQAAIVVRDEPGSQREHEGNVENHDSIDDQDLQPVQVIKTLDTQSELSVDL